MIGFYAGSFDPFTIGHLEIVTKASKIFDKVIIGIGINSAKAPRFDREKMKNAINQVLKNNNLTNCECVLFGGLTTNSALFYKADFLIRGIRNGVDYGYEENLASINEELSGLDTLYFRAGKYGIISSSMVVELYKNNYDISKYVPEEILKIMLKN